MYKQKGDADERSILKKLYECMPTEERAWLARVALLACVLLIGVIATAALASSAEDMETHSLSDPLGDAVGSALTPF